MKLFELCCFAVQYNSGGCLRGKLFESTSPFFFATLSLQSILCFCFLFLFHFASPLRTRKSDAGRRRVHLRGCETAETNSNQAANHAPPMKRELCLRRYKTIFVLFFRDCPQAASPSPAICFNLLQLCSSYFLKAQRCGTYRQRGAFARTHHSTSSLGKPYNLQTCTALLRFMKQWHGYSQAQRGLSAKHLSALLAASEG